MKTNIILGIFLLTNFCNLSIMAQDETPKPPKPHFSLGANLILSTPLSDFGDDDLMNPDAGFADFGAGFGAFAHFEYKSGFFIQINLDHTRRSSNAWSASASEIGELLNDQDQTNNLEFTARTDPRYRHTSFLFGPGYNLKMENLEIYLRTEFGISNSTMTKSSIEDNTGRTYNFSRSGDAVAAFGVGFGTTISELIRIDFSYTDFGSPEFQLQERNDDSEFSIPIQVFEIGLGIMIIK